MSKVTSCGWEGEKYTEVLQNPLFSSLHEASDSSAAADESHLLTGSLAVV